MVLRRSRELPELDEADIREERFCQAFVETGNARKAYRAVYDNDDYHAAWVKAKKCAARIKELRELHAHNHGITVGHLLDELEEARAMALAAEDKPQTAAAVAATMGKAKLLGMDKQIMEHVGKDGAPLSVDVHFVKPNNG